MTRLSDLLAWARQELAALGEEEAKASAEALLMEIAGLSRSSLFLDPTASASDEVRRAFEKAVEGRRQRIPLAYLTGKSYFWDMVLTVSPACLIPRPETELLVEQFIENSGFGRADSFSFLDLCCGSGAIGIALLRSFPASTATFSDISPEALDVTRGNLKKYDLEKRSSAVESDLFEAFGETGASWDAILCNPPYLSSEDLKRAQPELLSEPRRALDGGLDGLVFYRAVAEKAPAYLKSKGILVFELGFGQAADVESFVKKHGFLDIKIYKDYADIPRVLSARKDG